MNGIVLLAVFVIGILILFTIYSIARRNKMFILVFLLVIAAVIVFYIYTNNGQVPFLSSLQP